MGVCSDIQNKMTACFQKEVHLKLLIIFKIIVQLFSISQLKERRNQGVTSNHSIDYYIKKDPKLAEKVKLLEELRAKKEATESK